jgi:hypothetical protein
MQKDVFSFDDFVNKNSNELNLDDSNEYFEQSLLTKDRVDYLLNDFGLTKEDLSNMSNVIEDNDEYYNLYRDVNENFSCDIFIEGTNPEKAKARLVVESEDWNLVFNGVIENGKCNIPIKKLDILSENLTGDIKLEIIAEGNVFIPWHEKFMVKSSKRVSTINEKVSKEIDVKVGRIK